MPKRNRKTLFVDPRVQGTVLLRIFTYWFCCLLFIMLPHLIAISFMQPETTVSDQMRLVWQDCRPLLIATLLILPMSIYDILKLTNRFTGPIFRLQEHLSNLAKGEKLKPLHFREGDYWQELVEPMNKIAERLDSVQAMPGAQQSST